MTFSKEKALSVLQRKEVLFSDKLNPVEVLPYLTLTDMSKQEIKCEQINYGEKRATSLLLKRIKQQDKCLVEFVKALRDLLQNDLADLLDPCNIITDTGQVPGAQTAPKTCVDSAVTQTSSVLYHGKTPIRQLPCVVMEHLQKMDYDEKWRDLAAHLGYTIEDVQKLQSMNKSCTKQIIESWYDATIDDLYKALHAVGRMDIMTELEKVIGYKSFIDIQECQNKMQDVCTSTMSDSKTNKVLEERKKESGEELIYSRKQAVEADKVQKEGKETGDVELIYSRKQTDDCQQSNFVSSQDFISERVITHPVSKVCKLNIDMKTEPFSVENNALQQINERKNVTEKFCKDENHIFKSTENAGKQGCVSNSNTVFQEKTMKDKVLRMENSHVIYGAAAIGAIAVGLFLFTKSS